MSAKDRITRDSSWLSFNARVLQEAADKRVPLLERLRFLAIYSDNLDEFYRVRVAALRQYGRLKKNTQSALAVLPEKELNKIQKTVDAQLSRFGRIFTQELLPALRREGIHLLSPEELSEENPAFLEACFEKDILPKLELTSWATDSPPPLLRDKTIYFVLTFDGHPRLDFAALPVPPLSRFIALPTEGNGSYKYAFIDDLIRLLLPEYCQPSAKNIFAIKLSRDAELYIDDEYSGDLLEKIRRGLDKRNIGPPTRLLFDEEMPYYLVRQLMEIFGLSTKDLVPGARYHNFSDFMQFPAPGDKPQLQYEKQAPLPHSLLENAPSLLAAISQEDFLLHFPYQRWDYIPRLIREAAEAPEIGSIKITFYRVAQNSTVIDALLFACQLGKSVTVFIEAKARFDEASNLDAGERLEKAGARVLYSYPGIKVHAKMLLITQKTTDEEAFIKGMVYLSTGNFNEKTARIYGDHGFFSADPDLVQDVSQVFGLLERKILLPRCKKLLVAPYQLRAEFIRMVGDEIKNRKQGKEAWMVLKMNSLEDPEMIRWLYEASRAGVKVQLLVRGICCLKAGVPGLSEHITALSIVDRYLEHARVYVFANGGNPKTFLSSADWMTRNLDRRVEVAWPLTSPKLTSEIMHFLHLQLADNTKARILDAMQHNYYQHSDKDTNQVQSQKDFYQFLKDKTN